MTFISNPLAQRAVTLPCLLYTSGQGKFHPLKFLKAVSEDVEIFEHTKVRKATPDGVQTLSLIHI